MANYFSSVKTCFTALTGAPGYFDSYHVKLIKKRVPKALQHEVSRAYPLPPEDLTKIIQWFFLKQFWCRGCCLCGGSVARIFDISKAGQPSFFDLW